MKKTKFIIPVLLLVTLLVMGVSCGKEENGEKVEEAEREVQRGGSCNSIELDSTCTDFVGPGWSSDYCTEEGHVYSAEECPSPTVGGCRYNRGGEREKVIWTYNYGGRPIIWQDEVKTLRDSCTHYRNPGEWIPGGAEINK
jgi:hypothetical protein